MRLVSKFFRIFTAVIVFCSAARAEDSHPNLEMFYANQIGWTAAHINIDSVTGPFQHSFRDLLADKNKLSQLQGTNGQRILQQGRRLLTVIDLKAKLSHCAVSGKAAQNLKTSLDKALEVNVLCFVKCLETDNEQQQSLSEIQKNLKDIEKNTAKDNLLSIAKSHLAQTERYWDESSKQNSLDIALELMSRSENIKEDPPQTGNELLFYTKALQERKDKNYISQKDIKTAFVEIKKELENHKTYLESFSSKSADETFQNLIVTNPASIAELISQSPAAFEYVCQALKSFDEKSKLRESLKSSMLWGGLIVGGVLLTTGILGVAALAVSNTAIASTLTATAASAAIFSASTGTDELIYTSSLAEESFLQARNLQAAAFAEVDNKDLYTSAKNSLEDSYSQFASAGMSALSILPFGSGLKLMKKTAQASKASSMEKALQANSKLEAETFYSLTSVIKEISTDTALNQIMETNKGTVSSDEMGLFLGLLSSLPFEKRSHIFNLIKKKPAKVGQAIRESKSVGACK
ncbi:MAG: tolA protein [Pseudobdellovibrionaceae bacterium]